MMRGLGLTEQEYQLAYADYLTQHRAWRKQRDRVAFALDQVEIYKDNLLKYEAQLSHHQTELLPAYEAQMQAWAARAATHEQRTTEWDRYRAAYAEVERRRAAIQTYYETYRFGIADRWGWHRPLPAESCTNASAQAFALSMCAHTTRQAALLHGLGGEVQRANLLYGTDAQGVLWCAKAEVPICQVMPAYPSRPTASIPAIGPQPVAPREPVPPGTPPAIPDLGPEPQPPAPPAGLTVSCAPADVLQRARLICEGEAPNDLPEPFASNPCSTSRLPACEDADDSRRAAFAVGGLLLLVVGGGGYLLYRSFKKP